MRSFASKLFATGVVAIALSVSPAPAARARAPEITALRSVQPLMEGWKFVQDDALSDEATLTASIARSQGI
jgi:hypothetical protein